MKKSEEFILCLRVFWCRWWRFGLCCSCCWILTSGCNWCWLFRRWPERCGKHVRSSCFSKHNTGDAYVRFPHSSKRWPTNHERQAAHLCVWYEGFLLGTYKCRLHALGDGHKDQLARRQLLCPFLGHDLFDLLCKPLFTVAAQRRTCTLHILATVVAGALGTTCFSTNSVTMKCLMANYVAATKHSSCEATTPHSTDRPIGAP
mmetsp:Transcript_3531/g.6806  ORF Transcript_3531/g.6806 Transcript_3531/m.6806 type:complete len:203 (+) Transcript_3531:619-1227(+)